MPKRIIVFALAAGAIADCALAQAGEYPQGVYSGPKTHIVGTPKPRRRHGGNHVACTFLGCQPIPANCRPATGYSFSGEPTGFDVIVCR